MQFIEMMVPLDEEAIAIANYASSHSQSPQIKILADQISKAHSDEVNQLRQWYKNWYTRDLQVYSSKPTVNPYANGAAVDRVFIREMIRHDQATVKMAAMVVDSARKPEIRELAQSIINKYNDEISQLTALLQQ